MAFRALRCIGLEFCFRWAAWFEEQEFRALEGLHRCGPVFLSRFRRDRDAFEGRNGLVELTALGFEFVQDLSDVQGWRLPSIRE